ncbi:MAG: helix-turn-helix domain-containing protein [Acidobacteria bacterium]|nr:helix-turn-helix domain-containing protein [Acidobacteriota bacterium]
MKDQLDRLIVQMVEGGIFFQDAVAEFEKRYIRAVLEINGGNQSQTAKALGIHRNTLGRKAEEYKLASRNGSRRSPKGRPSRK